MVLDSHLAGRFAVWVAYLASVVAGHLYLAAVVTAVPRWQIAAFVVGVTAGQTHQLTVGSCCYSCCSIAAGYLWLVLVVDCGARQGSWCLCDSDLGCPVADP